MESEEKEEKQNTERVKIYINIEPLGLKIGYVFKKSETFQSIINFVFNQVKKLGVKYKKSPAQIVLRWHIQKGNVVFPKSTNPKHIKENSEIFDFSISSILLSSFCPS